MYLYLNQARAPDPGGGLLRLCRQAARRQELMSLTSAVTCHVLRRSSLRPECPPGHLVRITNKCLAGY